MGSIADSVGNNGNLATTQGNNGSSWFSSLFGDATLGKTLGAAGGVFDAVGGAASDLFAAQGARQSQKAYLEAAQLAGDDISFARAAGNIQEVQQQRQLYKVLGQNQTVEAANGFSTNSGTAGDLLRQSVQQGALATSLIRTNTAIKETGYEEQQKAYLQEASAAGRAASAGVLGAIGQVVKGGLAVAGLFA